MKADVEIFYGGQVEHYINITQVFLLLLLTENPNNKSQKAF